MSFARWQPRYAAAGIATFPVTAAKVPAVRNYLKIGLPASRELAGRFGTSEAFGLSLGPATRLTVLDVDTPDERVLADAIDRHGQTPVIVRSGSGNFQAWYRHNGEGRRIRPNPARPIDILGGGFVVAPPSRTTKGRYGFIAGSLDDLPDLPAMTDQEANLPLEAVVQPVGLGQRNDTLWRRCMAQARHCDDFEALLDVARTEAEAMIPPLPDAEIVKVAQSAWGYTERGENWFGAGRRVVASHDEVDGLMMAHPDAFILLTWLRRHHGGHTDFHVANDMCERMPGGWTRKRMAAARAALEQCGQIETVQPPSSFHGPAVYRLGKGGQN